MQNLRTSSYVIYAPIEPTPDGKNTLLVHGYTGAYDRVSDNVVSYLKQLEVKRGKPLYGEWVNDESVASNSTIEISEASSETLRRRGYLTELNVDEEETVFKSFVGMLHSQNSRTPSYIIMPTYNCNLRCSYCFQDHMRTNPFNQHLLRTMTRDTVDRMFLGMSEIERRHGIDPATFTRPMTFFGGEPLLRSSKEIVSYIISKARSLGKASFTAVSNATELDAYPDLLGPEAIAGIQITLDGPPDEHDKRRIYPDGGGSFEKIARNISMTLDLGVSVSVRLNLDKNNIDDIPRLAETMRQRGWTAYPNFSVYTAPIQVSNSKTDRATTFNSLQLDAALTKMRATNSDLVFIQRPDDRIISAARKIFHAGVTEDQPSYHESFCSAHTGMYIFDAFSDVYACWEKTGDPAIRIGHINMDGSVDLKVPVLNEWRDRTVASNPTCSKCRYALQCGGGCAVLAAGKNGSYHTNYCDNFASRFKTSIAEAYGDHRAGRSMQTADRVCDQ
jgi:uncharacterized protein